MEKFLDLLDNILHFFWEQKQSYFRRIEKLKRSRRRKKKKSFSLTRFIRYYTNHFKEEVNEQRRRYGRIKQY